MGPQVDAHMSCHIVAHQTALVLCLQAADLFHAFVKLNVLCGVQPIFRLLCTAVVSAPSRGATALAILSHLVRVVVGAQSLSHLIYGRTPVCGNQACFGARSLYSSNHNALLSGLRCAALIASGGR